MQDQCRLSTLSLAACALEIDSLASALVCPIIFSVSATHANEPLSKQDMKRDERLHCFGAQYVAFSHFWLAFHAHQHGSGGSSDVVATEARQGLSMMLEAFEREIIGSPSISIPKIAASPSSQKLASPKLETKVPVPTAKRRANTMKTPAAKRTLPGSYFSFPIDHREERSKISMRHS